MPADATTQTAAAQAGVVNWQAWALALASLGCSLRAASFSGEAAMWSVTALWLIGAAGVYGWKGTASK